MTYQKFTPCDLLVPYVECYFVWQSSPEGVKDLIVESPPSGYCSIVFNCGDDYFLQNKKYEQLKVPKQFICGQSIYSYKLFLNGYISIAGIVFKPSALATLFGLPTYEYTEERIDFRSVFSKPFVHALIENIQQATDANTKV